MTRGLLAVATALALSACTRPAPPAAATPPRQDPLPGTKLTVEQLQQQMFHVSAGKRLKGPWPNGAKVAVGLSFDVDNATATLSTGTLDYEVISRGEYGAVDGVPRLLKMLDRQQVPVSWFIPAMSAVLHPDMIKQIQGAAQKHEIGIHGWIHERLPLLNDEKEEQRLLNQSIYHRRDAQHSHPLATRLWYLYLQHRLRLILACQQFLFDSRPVLAQVWAQLRHGHLIDSRCAAVPLHPLERRPHVLSFDHCFHQLLCFRSRVLSPCRDP